MSAVGTTLLQSLGWNEGKARYETLGKHRQKRNELRRSGTHSEHLPYVSEVPPLWGSIKMFQWLTQGLRPGLWKGIALAGLLYVSPITLLFWYGCPGGYSWILQWSSINRGRWAVSKRISFYLFFCGALQNAVITRHWDWRRREFTLVNDGAWMSKITQRVPYYAIVSPKGTRN